MISSIGTSNRKFCRNDKGFSLVELIVVIAIMAILIGVVGSQVIPYMNSSKRAKDLQIISTYLTAAVTAYTGHPDGISTDDPLIITITAGTDGDVYDCDDAPIVAAEMKKLIDKDFVSEADAYFASKEFKKTESIVVTFDFEAKQVTVVAKDGADNDINNEEEVKGIL